MTTDFATLVFKGSRFDGGVMPLHVLPELAAYQDLVLSAARFLFTLRNPSRQRIDKGFEQRFRLAMKEIHEGSAVPQVIRLHNELPSLFPESPVTDEFDEARDLVEQLIQSEDIPPSFLGGMTVSDEVKRELFGKFNSFGKTLGKDEYVLVGAPGNRQGARYDHDKRVRLSLKLNTRYEDPVDLEGVVTKVDKEANVVGIRLPDGKKVDIRVTPLFIGSAIDSLRTNQSVRVQGTGAFDPSGKLLEVVLVTDLMTGGQESSYAKGCRLSISEQLAGIAQLAPGWFVPVSPGFQPADIEYADQLLKALVESCKFPVPYVYPTPEGQIRAEWNTSEKEWILELDVPHRQALAIVVDLQADNHAEEEIQLGLPGGETRLARFFLEHQLAGE